MTDRRHRQVVRQRSAKPLPPVRIWVAPWKMSAVFLLLPCLIDILAAVKRTAIPKPHDLGFCFFPVRLTLTAEALRGSAPALTDLLCSGLMVALQTDTASPAAKIFLLALISRSW